MSNMRIAALILTPLLAVGGLSACSSDADVASHNLSKEADNFQIYRKIVFYNAITDKYILEVDGFCSIGNNDGPGFVSITCKMNNGQYIKDHFFKSDNTTVFSSQVRTADVSVERYKVIWKPTTIIPDPEIR